MIQKSKVMSCDPRKSTFPDIKFMQTAPTSSGKTYLLKHSQGKDLTRDQAIKAKCADCMGLYVDGRADCEVPDCPLYAFMPYRKKDRG